MQSDGVIVWIRCGQSALPNYKGLSVLPLILNNKQKYEVEVSTILLSTITVLLFTSGRKNLYADTYVSVPICTLLSAGGKLLLK
jgi:hypothetical protein